MTATLTTPFDPSKAGPFCYEVAAYTDVIGGNVHDTKYAKECLTIDPFAELENGCLVVWQLCGGHAYMERWRRTRKDQNGRFIKPGSDCEAFVIGSISYTTADIGKSVNILGRVVGAAREFPRESPAAYVRGKGGAK